MRWIRSPLNEELAAGITRELGISGICAQLLAGRGFHTVQEVEAFLSPSLKRLADPLDVGQMPEAVARLEQALEREESVLIFGDYDVDGVTSTAFLTHFLRQFGLNPRYVVPRRLEEGYGLSMDSLGRALADGKPDLFIAVDCGTSSMDEVRWLREQGVSVLILDHHTSKESLPEDCILVNPHVHDGDSVPWKNLCSVGLVFKFCHAILKVLRAKGDSMAGKTDLREYLDLVAMGTVADLVQLDGENRILVKTGLRSLMNCRRPGICALMRVAGLEFGQELTAVDIGFRLGPRINASGRLDDATLPIQMLLGEDIQACRTAADTLDAFNTERQEIERRITEEAERLVEAHFGDAPGIIVHSADWHAGVVGIVASRIARKFNRPTLVLGSDADRTVKGSGRSVEGVDLVRILSECTEHIVQWGGHPMAVGLTALEDRIDSLRAAFVGALERQFPDGLPEPSIRVDAEVPAEALTEELLTELDRLAPFGQGNQEPVLAIRGAIVSGMAPLGKGHLRFTVQRGNGSVPIDGVAWNAAPNPLPAGTPVDLAARFHWHEWRGDRSPRLTLVDWRRASPDFL